MNLLCRVKQQGRGKHDDRFPIRSNGTPVPSFMPKGAVQHAVTKQRDGKVHFSPSLAGFVDNIQASQWNPNDMDQYLRHRQAQHVDEMPTSVTGLL